jgi:hypothetical protein
MLYHDIDIPGEVLARFCQRHRVRRLSLFGSILRDDFRADSDVDVLVEFNAGNTPGFGFVGIEEELSAIIGRKVDLNTPGFLSKYILEEVLREAEVLYDAA